MISIISRQKEFIKHMTVKTCQIVIRIKVKFVVSAYWQSYVLFQAKDKALLYLKEKLFDF